jgi:hypothetical protein
MKNDMCALHNIYLPCLYSDSLNVNLFLAITATLQITVFVGKGHPAFVSSHINYACKLVRILFSFWEYLRNEWFSDIKPPPLKKRDQLLYIRFHYVVCFLLVNSPAPEFCMPTFRNTLFRLHRQVGKEWLNLRMVGVSIWERVWLKNSLNQLEDGWRGRGGSVYKASSERLMTRMEVAGGYVTQIWLVSGWAKGWQVKTIVL